MSPHDTVRAAALGRIHDQKLLSSVARHAMDPQTSADAVGRIADASELLNVALKTEHKDAGVAALERAVESGGAGGDVRDTLEKTFPDIKTVTKRIYTAGPIPNDTVSVRANFPSELRAQIEKALLDYANTDAGKSALKSLYSIDGLDKAQNATYDPLLDAAKLAGLAVGMVRGRRQFS